MDRNEYHSKLINFVKPNPILWYKLNQRKGSVFYTESCKVKKIAWQEIGEKLGVSSNKVRRSWQNLRRQYLDEIKMELEFGCKSTWCFFNEMDFIRSVIRINGKMIQICKYDFESEISNSDDDQDKEETLANSTTSYVPTNMANNNENENAKSSKHILNFDLLQSEKRLHPHKAKNISTFNEANEWQTNENNFEIDDNKIKIENACDFDSDKCDEDTIQLEQETLPNDIDMTCMTNTSITIEPTIKIERDYDLIDKDATLSNIARHDIEETSLQLVPNSAISLMPDRVYSPANSPVMCNSILTENSRAHIESSAERPRLIEDATDSEIHDDDYHFVISLLPSLRSVTPAHKHNLRMQIMNLINNVLELPP